MTTRSAAVLVVEQRTLRRIAETIIEPLTLALALSLGLLGGILGWEARIRASLPAADRPTTALSVGRLHAPAEAEAYADALCLNDKPYLLRNTGESTAPMPWEPRLTEWALPCLRHRYLGALVDRLGRDQYAFALVRGDGTEVLYLVTFGHDGRVAGID